MSRDCDIAWAAGLFEGEGCVTQCRGTLNARLKMTDEAVVRRFEDVVCFGEVYGPYNYAYRDGLMRKPFWVWVANEYDALEVVELLWPWLSDRRRAQVLDLAPIEAILLNHPD